MVARTWLGNTSSQWSDPLNWSFPPSPDVQAVPGSGDDVTIIAGSTQPVLDENTANLGSLTITANASLAVGTFTLNVAGIGNTAIDLSSLFAVGSSTITIAGGQSTTPPG
jgi:hypothetical protein